MTTSTTQLLIQNIRARVRGKADDIRAEGATALFIYGSRARGDHRADSDLDVFVDHDDSEGFSLLNLAGIKLLIEAETGLEVHITTRDSLHPKLRRRIEREAIRLL